MKLSLSGTCSGFFLLPPFHTVVMEHLLHSHKLTFSVVWKHGRLKFPGSHCHSLTERKGSLPTARVLQNHREEFLFASLRSWFTWVNGSLTRTAVSPESQEVVAWYKFYFLLISQSFVDGSSHLGIPSLRVSGFSTRLYASIWQRKTGEYSLSLNMIIYFNFVSL